MEKPDSLFRHRSGKEKVSTSHTERSLFQEEFYSFQDLDLGVNVGKPLLRSKSDSKLKQIEINPNRFESYLLYSLWKNLQKTVNIEESSFLSQTYQPHISIHVHNPPQNPPVLKNPPVVSNPPRPMTSRFAPLALPTILNDLTQNYSQIIPLYDGEGNFTTR